MGSQSLEGLRLEAISTVPMNSRPFVTHADKPAIWGSTAERGLSIDLGLQLGSVGTLFEFRYGPTSDGGQLWGIGVRCPGRPRFSVVDGV
jgi:hypothetical protein